MSKIRDRKAEMASWMEWFYDRVSKQWWFGFELAPYTRNERRWHRKNLREVIRLMAINKHV